MLFAVAALAFFVLADAPVREEPPSKAELAAMTERGRDLAAYDDAAWHATDAVQAKQPKAGSVVRYIARKTEKGWVVVFGREERDTFLIAYQATPTEKRNVFEVQEMSPPKEDRAYFLFASRAIDTSLKEFVEHLEGGQRPYNVAVLPADKGQMLVYVVPAPTRTGVWPLGGDARYLIAADGSRIVEKRQLHKSILELEPPKNDANKLVEGIHTHVLDDTPEDTDVFHVLTRKPRVPEMIVTKQFVFQVDTDGTIKYVGKPDKVLKNVSEEPVKTK